MSDLLQAKFDGGCFGPRRWFVGGYASHQFTTEADAKAAIGLAYQVARNDCREILRIAVKAIEGATP